jgi:phosphoribosylformylglycinamidine synthase
MPGKTLGPEALAAVKNYLVNPVDSRIVENVNALPDTLEQPASEPDDVPVLQGFVRLTEAELVALALRRGLAMSAADLVCCRDYFAGERRDPTLTELRVLDTYWSDHCRHTTFNTILDKIEIAEAENETSLRAALDRYEAARKEVYGDAAENPRTLMDMAVIGAKVLKRRGMLSDLDESKEINACTIRVNARFARAPCGDADDGETKNKTETEEPWLLLFKNETHNHPTEIEPFGGAATCLGGAIRDPLSGRAYVHQAMRITGGGDPRTPLARTLPGKLPQIKIAREAAAGYSSYGNQIGLATGQVAEFYHAGYVAKRLELGAVIGAVPVSRVRRAEPARGDLVLLIGGATGRDGIGGATGSSKAHSGGSVESAGAEVQKGNAVEERKLQRLFRNARVTRRIKRCNDFGAGGVSVAVGELAAGLDIDLDAVPKKYDGLDGTELAISESQERMAVVAAPEDAAVIIAAAAEENLSAVIIARVTHEDAGAARLRMSWRGKTIVDLSRVFLDSNGAPRHADVFISPANGGGKNSPVSEKDFTAANPSQLLEKLRAELASLRSCSRRGLQERFDASIGASSVLFPWGGKEQATPECGMAALLPSPIGKGRALTASLMCFGFDPYLTEANPCEGAKAAVKEALAKFACLGGDPWKARLSIQEYFERMEGGESWGRAAAALLGALEAQLVLGVPAVGGKDSMSGTYRDRANGIDLAVPPTLAVFAAGCAPAGRVRSGALSGRAGNAVLLLYQNDAADWESFRANLNALSELSGTDGLVKAAYPVGAGGIAAALALMCFGNMTGVDLNAAVSSLAGGVNYAGALLLEVSDAAAARELLDRSGAQWREAARIIDEKVFRISARTANGTGTAETPLADLRRAWEETLDAVYPRCAAGAAGKTSAVVPPEAAPAAHPRAVSAARPLVILPVFSGTNCEYDMERAFLEAGARTRQLVFRNRSAADIAASIKELAAAIGEAQIVALSGGFSAGDEPDGSGKFIANAFRAPAVAGAVRELLENRGGLMLGICNGFQALIKLGLVPYGRYVEASEISPTLTFNTIGRHVSRMVRTRVTSTLSPWLFPAEAGAVHVLPVSHGEGRLVVSESEAARLSAAGQIPFRYVDGAGVPAVTAPDNPNGSDYAIEGLTSPDGRVLGKMAHSERRGEFVHINIPGNKTQRIFEAGVSYFR